MAMLVLRHHGILGFCVHDTPTEMKVEKVRKGLTTFACCVRHQVVLGKAEPNIKCIKI